MPKKKLKGIIVSDATDKTVVVIVDRFKKHPKYQKYMKVSKKYKAHDEKNEYKKGETVVIEECRPMSKDKRFKVINRAIEAKSEKLKK
jgi:small subunit ribosomal protein S17